MKRLILLIVCVYTHLNAQIAPEQVTTQMIKNKVTEITQAIIDEQQPNGSWNYNGHISGSTALHLLALATAGLTEKHPAIQKGIAYLQENFPENDTYSIGMYACAFQAIDQRKYKNEIKRAADWLAGSSGVWRTAQCQWLPP